jgi:hypothetical protein
LARRKRFKHIRDIVSSLRTLSSSFGLKTDSLLARKNLSPFVEVAQSLGGGVSGVRQALRRIKGASWDGWVYGTGEIDGENLIKRIFQEVYLGRRFPACYHCPRIFYFGPAYSLHERLLIPRRILASLRKKTRLGIATGRPRFDAELALRRFRIVSYFDTVVTLDECQEAEHRLFQESGKRADYSKPHPYALLRAAEEIGSPSRRCAYIGDAVDDMKAARAAGKKIPMRAIGFVVGHVRRRAARKSLLRAGADMVIEDPKDLLKLVLPLKTDQGLGHH